MITEKTIIFKPSMIQDKHYHQLRDIISNNFAFKFRCFWTFMLVSSFFEKTYQVCKIASKGRPVQSYKIGKQIFHSPYKYFEKKKLFRINK